MRNEGDPLDRYRVLVSTHSTRVRPRLEALRQQVDTILSDIVRTERENLRAQAQALAGLRRRIACDARFLLRDADFPAFAARLTSPPPWLGVDLGEAPGPDPASWRLSSSPHALAINDYREHEEPGYDDERDCILELLSARLTLGPAACPLELERGRVSLFQYRQEPDPFCQYHELALQLDPTLAPACADGRARALLAREVSCLVCYALPILRLRPAAVDFTYPLGCSDESLGRGEEAAGNERGAAPAPRRGAAPAPRRGAAPAPRRGAAPAPVWGLCPIWCGRGSAPDTPGGALPLHPGQEKRGLPPLLSWQSLIRAL
jgi:hypothetical protein